VISPLRPDDGPVYVRPSVYAVLEKLMQNPGRIVKPRTLYYAYSDRVTEYNPNTVQVDVLELRRALGEKSDDPRKIVMTVRGAGYRLNVPKPALKK